MRLFNTLTNKKEEFKPIEEGKVSIYICGPTVYNHAHIGNTRPMIVFDVLRRTFEYLGNDVTFVSNYTDVDDKIIKKANEDARFILPNASTTKIVCTFNARSLQNFFAHRCCNRAQWEIREVAEQMLLQCLEVAPHLFKNCGPSCLFGPCPEGNMCCGKQKEMRQKYGREK
mgnify:CR=1 FL=1